MPDVGSRFEIVDESGNECPIDKEGELRVRLRDIDATSYLDDEEASRKCFRDGYFYPVIWRSVARMAASVHLVVLRMFLTCKDRRSLLLPLSRRFENFLRVNAVCLFSFLNDDGREELVVAIEANRAPPKSELDKISREFRSFERVRFEVLQEFPRTEAGMQKIKRTELRKIIVGKGAGAGRDPN